MLRATRDSRHDGQLADPPRRGLTATRAVAILALLALGAASTVRALAPADSKHDAPPKKAADAPANLNQTGATKPVSPASKLVGDAHRAPQKTDPRKLLAALGAKPIDQEKPTKGTRGGVLGACCLPDNNCVEFTQTDCGNMSGIYQGDFTTCFPGICDGGGPPNDDCANFIQVFSGTTPFSTVGATTDGPLGDCPQGTTFDDIWFWHIAECTGEVIINLCAATYNTHLSIYDGGCPPQVLLACNNDGCGLQSQVQLDVIAGLSLLIRVGGFIGDNGTGLLDIGCIPDKGGFCGDGIVDPGEDCDPPDGVTCDDNCQFIQSMICGDGIVDPGEQCDPPDGITCDENCQFIVGFCGDGIIDPGEQCDPPDGVTCDPNCQFFCGNGFIDPGEQCDPPDGVVCDSNCQLFCGNGVIDPGEQCDPPDGVTCDGFCQFIFPPNCGNGIIDPGEQCDPPDFVTCDGFCQFIIPPNCGNGIIDPGEQCDPPDGVTCDPFCQFITPPVCGNGLVEPGEDCDPPDGLTCDANCMFITGPDCNNNGVPDPQDIANGTSEDCNDNGIPDECDLAGGGSGTTIYQFDVIPPMPIPDNGGGVVFIQSTASVGDTTTIEDLDVDLNITHTWNGDLVVMLEHVDTGTQMTLLSRPGLLETNPYAGCCGFNNDGMDVILDDEAAQSIETANSGGGLLTGTYAPNAGATGLPGSLSVFDGQSIAGTWRLTVHDAAGGDTGTLNAWSLHATGPGSPNSQDCNGNLIPDECDIASGTSTDNNFNGIPDECETAECGNGVIEPGEQCDPPDGITCDANCQFIEPFCGNGVIDAGEQCDPPDGEVCDPNCQFYCGNGVVDVTLGEECDPPDGVTCDSNCRLFCGNGVIDPGEQCDPPDGVTCDPNCQFFCGNGVIDPGEECDPPDGVTCDANCQFFCGNGVIDPGEECDPPDGVTCDANCQEIDDCNDNGIPDADDIAQGNSSDHNGNNVPDDCEPHEDHWQTCTQNENEDNYQDFAGSPIPADFFGPGSDPFTGRIVWTGSPLDLNQTGNADTRLIRSGDPVIASDPTGTTGLVDLTIDQLNLQSVEPIPVTYNAGQVTQFWMVTAVLSPTQPPTGSLFAIKTHDNGGTFDSQIFVYPLLTFTRLDDPNDVRMLDSAQAGLPVLQMGSTGAPFVNDLDPSVIVVHDPTSQFVPGVEQTIPGDPTSQQLRPLTEAEQIARHTVCPPIPRIPPPDYWKTCTSGPDSNYQDFSETPIPGGFFGPGSDPFTGRVDWVGEPLDPAHTGEADTGLQRARDPVAPADPPGAVGSTPIEIIALNLHSVSPIVVTENGGMNPTLWDVRVELSPATPQSGLLTATKTHDNGGSFDSSIYVQPLFVFTRDDNPAISVVLDTALLAIPPIHFTSTGTPFVHMLHDSVDVWHDPAAQFVPGVEQTIPGDPTSQVPAALTEAEMIARHTVCPPPRFIPPDYWWTWRPPGGGSGHTYKNISLPTGFFGPGCEPFVGQIEFRGEPFDPLTTGGADTCVQRTGNPVLGSDDPGTVGATDIEINRLSLVSVEPITVICDGQPQEWEVTAELSPTVPLFGSLTATKTHANGGVFDSTLNVQPLLTFRRLEPVSNDCDCGDFDRDGQIGLADFSSFTVCFGATEPNDACLAADLTCTDLNGDGAVNLLDFTTFAAIFGQAATGLQPPYCLGDAPPNVITFDTAGVLPPLVFSAGAAPFVHQLAPNSGVVADPLSSFVPGVRETIPGVPSTQTPEIVIEESSTARHTVYPPQCAVKIDIHCADDHVEKRDGAFVERNLEPITPANFQQLKFLMRPVTITAGPRGVGLLEADPPGVVEIYTLAGEKLDNPAILRTFPVTLLINGLDYGATVLSVEFFPPFGPSCGDDSVVRVNCFPGLASETLTDFPHVEYVRTINRGAALTTSLDPARHKERVGMKYAAYVVAHKTAAQYAINNTLTDVTGGAEEYTVSAGGINPQNIRVPWRAAMPDGKYDIVFDFGNCPKDPDDFAADGKLDPGDIIGKLTLTAAEAELEVLNDPGAAGAGAINSATYNHGNFDIPDYDGDAAIAGIPIVGRFVRPAPLAAGTPLVAIAHGRHGAYAAASGRGTTPPVNNPAARDGMVILPITVAQNAVQETWTLTLKANGRWGIAGSVSGAQGESAAKVGTDWAVVSTNTFITLTVRDGATNAYAVDDTITFMVVRDPLVPNYDGYIYLQEHLARHGIASISIDLDPLVALGNGNRHRGWTMLKHIEAILAANGNLAADRIVLAGHSRGGEAALQAYRMLVTPAERPGGAAIAGFTAAGIRGVISISPTTFYDQASGLASGMFDDGGTEAGLNRPFLLLYGGADGDVNGINTGVTPFVTYDRAAAAKQVMFLEGANHNFFNTSWAGDDARQQFFSLTAPVGLKTVDPAGIGAGLVNPANTRAFANAYVTAFVWAYAMDRDGYADFFKRFTNRYRPPSVPGALTILNQYKDSTLAAMPNFVMDDYEANFDDTMTSSSGNDVDPTVTTHPFAGDEEPVLWDPDQHWDFAGPAEIGAVGALTGDGVRTTNLIWFFSTNWRGNIPGTRDGTAIFQVRHTPLGNRAVPEAWTATFDGPNNRWNIAGSVSGAQGMSDVGSPWQFTATNGRMRGQITDGATMPFANGDTVTFTYHGVEFSETQPVNRYRQDTHGVVISWPAAVRKYEYELTGAQRDLSKKRFVSIRVAKNVPDPAARGTAIEHTLTLEDENGNTSMIRTNTFADIPGGYPSGFHRDLWNLLVMGNLVAFDFDKWTTTPVFRTFRFDICPCTNDRKPIDLRKIRYIRFEYGGARGTDNGMKAMDDVEVTLR